MRFLVVEDELYVAEMIRAALEDLGNTCEIASTADQADRILAGQQFDAVTLDLGMPGRGGLDWLETIAEEQPDLARRTLVITGMSVDSGSAERLARCGAGMLAKPFSLTHLQDAVRVQIANPLTRGNGSD